jgi:A/G-specific adenine glycosylase
LPAKAAKKARPTRHGGLFWLTDAQGRVLLRRRPPHGLLGGMTELPGTEWRAEAWQEREFFDAAPMPAAWRHAGRVRHVFTHFELWLEVFAGQVGAITASGLLRDPSRLDEEALPSVMRKGVAVVLGGAA